MSLRLVHSRHDLPPFWDGEPVTWDEWSDVRTSLALHIPAHEMACDKCGAIDENLIVWGIRPPEAPTIMTTKTKTLPSGRKYETQVEVKAHPLRDIYASRCRHCGHDVVTDTRTDERWDLDETDYGPEGSTADTLF
ncbi:hypothetical protein PP353_gp64 [Arthrobacter phage Kumotta]|uniref:Uncharacterized protein n=2 Tax=Kumottavirus TaxID=3044749 RepID=A0A4Y6ELI1_9CAUD|nr:hypothetical protein PP353_gp64 [Arthrobacter phage Kumotta]YP_010649542.1 hypothetical protein PP356_gp60 [Arthrobacter phage MargaretKali]AXH44440.1 hypothetical protein SEA_MARGARETKALI_60 [Arthrobacter phage MargaretKali]QDF19573.1 hypothetical protein SEA_KUMOTTA_64 [Arthrobacter phage Kumotta]